MPFIYALCDPDTDEVRYIGFTCDLERRYSEHLLVIGKPNPHRKSWVQSLVRQGKQPRMKVLEEVTEEVWQEREMWWIAEMRRQGARLTNVTDGGDGVLHLIYSEASRQKMSVSAKIRASRPEERARLREKAKNQVVTDRMRQAPVETHTGRKRSIETCDRIRVSRVGMKFSPDHLANMSQVRLGHPAYNKGKPMPEHQKVFVSQNFRKLTDAQVEEIHQLLKQGQITQKAIAQQFGVTPQMITHIKQGYTYRTKKEN